MRTLATLFISFSILTVSAQEKVVRLYDGPALKIGERQP